MYVLERWSKFETDSPSEVIGIFESEELVLQAIEQDKLIPRFVSYSYGYEKFKVNELKVEDE